MAYNVLDIANKLLARAEIDTRVELFTNLKLQKMLYYEQGYHLAMFDTPLFDEEIEAWMYGPAIPIVYEHFKHNGRNGIMPETNNPIVLDTPEEETLFNDVFETYINYSAYGLMEETHKEMPWKSTPQGYGNVISKDKMKKFFSTKLIDEEN
ncbi:MAG: DUF4065 domain-containing protein [Bacteroidales bacterium]|nr:DUF4065 domain-containing protein [Bacteroidales bacterium]